MTRRLLPLILGLCALAPPLALAQAPQKPKPGPEHQRLAFFVGRWKGEAEVKQNPFMPAGKHTSSDTCEWFEGRFAVVCRNESRSATGTMKSLGLIGYSPEEKVYTYYGVESSPMAMTSVSRGTVEGGTWVYTDESKMGGKTVRSRYTIRETSPTSYTFTWEMQGDDGTWATVIEGKQTKMR
ncbi:MAG TPA: DUF1579 family protein [Anaeromyxobacteraceae bacterium]|nr:DUF1579 family protein [Anaeromyxobacteraceae bacterium]